MPGNRPKLAVTTPVTANFPSELSALSNSARTPISALSFPAIPRSATLPGNDDIAKTPISPPTAYSEFLRFMSLNSPVVTAKSAAFTFSPTSAPSSTPSSGATTPNSTPSTAASDCSCKPESDACSHAVKQEKQEEQPRGKSRKRAYPEPLPPPPPTSTKSAPLVPPSPYERCPMSAPASGVIPTFPSLHMPPSPALCLESPLTGTTAASATKSPYSARSVRSPFDWEAALKARFEGCAKPTTPVNSAPKSSSKTSVRHIREVVTRTVTYTPKNTPKMAPAPKGKRRKVE